MNSYLLNRTLGSISPHSFHVAQTTRLVHNLEPAPGIRFSSLRTEEPPDGDDAELPADEDILAHKSGVNVLAIDQHEGRL